MRKDNDRSITTMFMLVSVDGKISTGASDERDVDKDYPKIEGVREGLEQYYELERKTDAVSFNTGRVMAKIGVNDREEEPNHVDVDFVIVDTDNHLTAQGVIYLTKWVNKLYLVVTNKDHQAYGIKDQINNLEILYYEKKIDFVDLFNNLKQKYGVERLTLQSGGTMNAHLLRLGLIDNLSIVVAPVLIGGKDTSTLVDGQSLTDVSELNKLRPLELVKCTQLDNSYLHLEYKVVNEFEVS